MNAGFGRNRVWGDKGGAAGREGGRRLQDAFAA